MSESIITVENLSKRYRIGERERGYKTFREAIIDVFAGPVRNLKHLRKLTIFDDTESSHSILNPVMDVGKGTQDDVIWALQNVSFEIRQGEIVGIIGRNGAGKSTLLKILSRITEPTAGDIKIQGRVSSLLEVGTGFHPELTGRENVFLNGAILGMKRKEIERKFDEIVGFAEIDKFVDTPIKYYSSGMYVRLAFAVAAHLEPEILLMDEILAVGDAAFQKKCLGKMGDVAKEGRTVLFVSHNMEAVQRLCTRTIWLNGGRIACDGDSRRVVSNYMNTSFSALTEQVWTDISTAPGNERVRLRRACIRPEGGSPSDPVTIRTPFVMEFEYWNLEPDTYLNLSLHVYNEQGIMAFNTAPIHEPVWNGRPFSVGLFRSICHVPGDLLNDGIHTIELLIVKDQGIVIFRQENLLVFDVLDEVERRGDWYGKWAGAVRPNLKWSTEFIKTNMR